MGDTNISVRINNFDGARGPQRPSGQQDRQAVGASDRQADKQGGGVGVCAIGIIPLAGGNSGSSRSGGTKQAQDKEPPDAGDSSLGFLKLLLQMMKLQKAQEEQKQGAGPVVFGLNRQPTLLMAPVLVGGLNTVM